MEIVTSKRQRDMVNYLLTAVDSRKPPASDIESAVFVLTTLLINSPPVRVPITQPIEFSIAEGTIRTYSGIAFLNCLDGLKVSHFKRCKICNRLFYAAHADSEGCSDRHISTLRQREYRRKEREKK
jgi:hypothetical protein